MSWKNAAEVASSSGMSRRLHSLLSLLFIANDYQPAHDHAERAIEISEGWAY